LGESTMSLKRPLLMALALVLVSSSIVSAYQDSTIGEVIRNQGLIIRAIEKQAEQTSLAIAQTNAALNQTNVALALLTKEMDERTKALNSVNDSLRALTIAVGATVAPEAAADVYLQRGAYGGMIILTVMGSGWIITIRRANGKKG
jgi:hypothetical protein